MPNHSKKGRFRKTRKGNSKYSKKKFNKTYSKNRQNTVNTKVGNPFPPQIATRNNWAETSADIAQIIPGSLTWNTLLKLGSAYDPAASPGLSQESVQFHNIYSRYYSQYCVTYVKVNLKWRNTGQNDARIVCGISDDQNPTFTNVNMNEFQMANYTQTRVLEADQGSRYNRGNMTFKFNLNKWKKRNKINPEDWASVVATDPAKYPILYYAIQSESPAQTALVKVDITATYYTKYSRRNQTNIMKAQ